MKISAIRLARGALLRAYEVHVAHHTYLCASASPSLALGACWATLVLASPLAQAQVQANGATATTVTTQAGGRQAITPAASQRDVSYNAFSRFDVDKNGATFQNADVKARTIVAEVFSASPSRIEGAITVDGPRANLILANQNGIRVNGGSFVNFGSVSSKRPKHYSSPARVGIFVISSRVFHNYREDDWMAKPPIA